MRTIGTFWSVLYSFWAAILFCALYGAAGYLIYYVLEGPQSSAALLKYFVVNYGGLVTGTSCLTLFLMSILVLRSVPELITESFGSEQPMGEKYRYWKTKSESLVFGVGQFTIYFTLGVAIYSLLMFPVPETQRVFFVIFTSLQFGMGGYVGRRLWCIGHMLRSLSDLQPTKNVFESEALPRLIYLINIFTFLTLLMTLIHTYFHASIRYDFSGGLSLFVKPLVFLPVILAVPVIVLFNFFPRMVVNGLYLKSIRNQKALLAEKLESSEESQLAQMKHMIDYEKYLNEEFRYRQKVALSEFPVALTIVVAGLAMIIRILTSQ